MIKDFILTILIVFISGFALGSSIVAAINRLEFKPSVAQIEQLRSDVAKTRAGSNEDVIGQATKWNQTIREYQEYNAGPLDPYIDDRWDRVQLIEIPQN